MSNAGIARSAGKGDMAFSHETQADIAGILAAYYGYGSASDRPVLEGDREKTQLALDLLTVLSASNGNVDKLSQALINAFPETFQGKKIGKRQLQAIAQQLSDLLKDEATAETALR